MQKIKIELDEKFLNSFFGLTNTPYKIETLNLIGLKAQLENIEDELTSKYIEGTEKKEKKEKLKELSENKIAEEIKKLNLQNENILIYNNIGGFSYQVSDFLKKQGASVTVCTKSPEDALKMLLEDNYNWSITDINIATKYDDTEFIRSVNKLVEEGVLDCKVGIVSLIKDSSFEDLTKELDVKFYIKNEKDWAKKLKREFYNYAPKENKENKEVKEGE